MSDSTPQPEWRPGMTITGDTVLAPIASALAFGQNDDAYNQISGALHKRGIVTVNDWSTEYSKGEFCALLKSANLRQSLKKHRNAHLECLETTVGRKLRIEEVEPEDGGDGLVKVKRQSGGDMLGMCKTVKPSVGFNASKWTPDMVVYEGVPRKETCDYMATDAEKLYLDKLWLCAQVDPEPSLDDSYLPEGMAAQLQRVHHRMKLAAFKHKHFGKPKESPRAEHEVIDRAFFNKRFSACKRIVLCEEYRSLFSERVQSHLTFVPPSDASLQDNARNDAVAHFLAVRNGEAPKVELVFPTEAAESANNKENGRQAARPQPLSTPEPRAGDTAGDTTEPPEPPKPTNDDLLDGAGDSSEDEANGSAVPIAHPRMPAAAGGASNGRGGANCDKSKKELMQEKKRAAAAAKAGSKKKEEKKRVRDSSDEEEEEEEEPSGPGSVRNPPKPPAKKVPPMVQTQLKAMTLAEVGVDAPEVTAPPVDPPLTPDSAAQRFVFVPAEQFGSEGIGGWVAKIVKVGRTKDRVTEVRFKNADNKVSKHYFTFDHVALTFKPLSPCV